MCRNYYLHKRNGIFYVEFTNPENGKKLSARSTREKDEFKAQIKAELWQVNGIPTGKAGKPRSIEDAAGIENVIKLIRKSCLNSDDALKIVSTLRTMGLIDIAAVKNTGYGAVYFTQFILTFWNYDESPYIRDKLAHGYRFSRRYAHECLKRVNSELKPFFGDKKLNCVTTHDLKELSNQLAVRGLATSTINQILLVCQTPLRWAYKEKIIPVDPTVGLTKFSIKNKKRGVLSEMEAKALLFTEKELWKDKRSYVASLIAASTGARQGECLALRRSDVGEHTLNIAHSYSALDGLKCPKNGETRNVPLLPIVREAIMDLLKDNPHNVGDPFVFYSLLPDKPCSSNILLDGLKMAIESVNKKSPEIDIDIKNRNITFHSWRHFFCSKASEKIASEKVSKVSGHLSKAVFEKYADHIEEKNVQEVGDVIAEIFENIIPFPISKVG